MRLTHAAYSKNVICEGSSAVLYFVFQAPQDANNCAFIAVLCQFRDVPYDYSPDELRYAMIKHFCENIEDILVRHLCNDRF